MHLKIIYDDTALDSRLSECKIMKNFLQQKKFQFNSYSSNEMFHYLHNMAILVTISSYNRTWSTYISCEAGC